MDELKRVILVPIATILITIIFGALWIVLALQLYSCGELYHLKTSPIMKLGHSNEYRYYSYVMVFALFWGLAFLLSASSFIISSCACFWYFNNHIDTVKYPVLRSVQILFRYHFGTIAFGSLILAILWALQEGLNYIEVRNLVVLTPRTN